MLLSGLDFDLQLAIFILLCCAFIAINLYGLFRLVRPKQESEAATDIPRVFRKSAAKLLYRARYLWIDLLLVIFASYIAFVALSAEPYIVRERSYPMFDGYWDSYDNPVEVNFNVPVEISRLRPNISPDDLKGEWKYDRYLGFLPMTRRAVFYPENTMLPERRIVVYFTGVSRYRLEENHEHALNFYSHQAPEVFSVKPFNDSNEININVPIEIEFNQPLTDSSTWEYKFEPEIEFTIEYGKGNKSVKLTPTKQLNQGETYRLSIYRTSVAFALNSSKQIIDQDNPELVHELTFSTVKAPLVKRFTPTGTGVRENSQIKLVFETDMEQEMVDSKLTISPEIQFNRVWEDNRTLVITPISPLPKETEFTVTLASGLRTKNGGISELEVKYSFTTIGAVRVSSFEPQNGLVRVPINSVVRVTFDQEVDHNSAQPAFSITPGTNGGFTWEGNTMIFTPSQPLAYGTNYTVKVNPGVKTIFGLDSRETFTTTFTTASNFTLINGFSAATADHQDYDMTCAVATAKMALAWKGIYVSEQGLYNLIGRDPYQYLWDSGRNAYTWGDPNRGFLGPINGGGGTNPERAFGVYWYPIQRVFRDHYGITTEVKQGWNIYDLARTLEQGHPVQIWAWNGLTVTWGDVGGKRMDWYDAATGNQIYAINGMHSWLIVGFYGTANNPTHFIYEDPWRGFVTKPASEFDYHWSFYNKTGLVIH